MAKDPAFLFYPGDWLGGTMGMTFEEKGAYLELLLFQFNNGKFTIASAKLVLSICSASAFEKVIQKFDTDGKYYWKQKLHDEIERRKKFTESRRNNAKSNKSYQKNKKAYAKHMETETETVTITNNTKRVISKNDIFEKLFSDDLWIEQMEIAHKGKDLKQAWEECYSHHSVNPSSKDWQSWEWKQKLNSWLTIKPKKNGTKQTERNSSLIEGFAKRVLADGKTG